MWKDLAVENKDCGEHKQQSKSRNQTQMFENQQYQIYHILTETFSDGISPF